jgi:hypothetical protein
MMCLLLGRCSQEGTYNRATPTSHSPPNIGDGDIPAGTTTEPRGGLFAADTPYGPGSGDPEHSPELY